MSWKCPIKRREALRAWVVKNRDWSALRTRLLRHAITLDQFHAMFENQDFGCAICARELDSRAGTIKANKVVLDHDHKTKKARGLLCHHCNCGLGQFFDTASLLRQGADYLERRV